MALLLKKPFDENTHSFQIQAVDPPRLEPGDYPTASRPYLIQHSDLRPPTPSKIRVSTNNSEQQSIIIENQNLRSRIKGLEGEVARLLYRINSMSSEQTYLLAEVEQLRGSEHKLRLQEERLEGQRKKLEAAADFTMAYQNLRQQILRVGEKLRDADPNWFVGILNEAEREDRLDDDRGNLG